MKDQILFTESEAAERLRLCTRTLRKARLAGVLPHVLIGRAVRYTVGDLESYVEAMRRQPMQIAPAPSSRRSRRDAKIIPFTARNKGR